MVRAVSNEEFGRRVGISHSLASRLRTGALRLTLRQVARVSAEFHIPIDQLVAASLGDGTRQAELLAEVAPRRQVVGRRRRVVGEASDREAEGSADQDAGEPVPARLSTSPTTEALD